MGRRTNLENNNNNIAGEREKAIILRGRRGGGGLELLRLQPVATKDPSLTA